MAEYSILSKEDIQNILREYDISDIESYKILSGGSENTNYVVSTASGKFVITICEQKTITEASDLAGLLEYLNQSGFATSEVISNRNSLPITVYNDKPIMVKAFIDGTIIPDLPGTLLELIGIEMGRLHHIQAPAYLPTMVSYGKEKFSQLESHAPASDFYLWLKHIQRSVEELFGLNLPKALIHSDVFYSNVIISNDERNVTIMDFEEASYYYRVFDIGMAIIGLCIEQGKINLQKAHSILKGYQKEVQMLPEEIKALQTFTVYAGASMSFWRYKNFNITRPTPEMKNHYQELKNIADYLKNLPAEVFQLAVFDNKL